MPLPASNRDPSAMGGKSSNAVHSVVDDSRWGQRPDRWSRHRASGDFSFWVATMLLGLLLFCDADTGVTEVSNLFYRGLCCVLTGWCLILSCGLFGYLCMCVCMYMQVCLYELDSSDGDSWFNVLSGRRATSVATPARSKQRCWTGA